jgi:two-component system CheB/CheR fusion protein
LVAFRTIPALRLPGKAAKRSATALKPTRTEALEQELSFAKRSLDSAVEELQSTNEDLRASSEEAESANEELQSSNEELETSKEEMQSLNEELQTTNAQLQSKVEAFVRAGDDIQNLLNSTKIATIFLDSQLRIRRFSQEAEKVFHLIPSDFGRPLADLASNLNYQRLQADTTGVLRTLVTCEKALRSREGAWRWIRIIPYRTVDNVVDGVVITFVDLTRGKRAGRSAARPGR